MIDFTDAERWVNTSIKSLQDSAKVILLCFIPVIGFCLYVWTLYSHSVLYRTLTPPEELMYYEEIAYFKKQINETGYIHVDCKNDEACRYWRLYGWQLYRSLKK